MVLGADLLIERGCIVDAKRRRLIVPGTAPLTLSVSDPGATAASALPAPYVLVLAPASGSYLAISSLPPSARTLHGTSGVFSATALSAEPVAYIVMNSSARPVLLKAGTVVASLAPVAPPEEIAAVAAAGPAFSPEEAIPESFPEVQSWTAETWAAALDAAVPADRPHALELREFLSGARGTFSADKDKVSTANVAPHRILTQPDQLPIRQHPRRVHPALQEVHSAELTKMLAAKVIEPSSSPWASSSVIVRKKDGTFRFCVDYRRLNEVTVGNAYPLPRIDEILDSFHGKKFFSTLDCQSGYWQIPLHPDDAHTARSPPSHARRRHRPRRRLRPPRRWRAPSWWPPARARPIWRRPPCGGRRRPPSVVVGRRKARHVQGLGDRNQGRRLEGCRRRDARSVDRGREARDAQCEHCRCRRVALVLVTH